MLVAASPPAAPSGERESGLLSLGIIVDARADQSRLGGAALIIVAAAAERSCDKRPVVDFAVRTVLY